MLVVDGSQPLSEQDVRILQTVREAGRALVIAFNKWDLVDEERRYYLDREIERDLVQVQWAPRINVTARTGWHVDRLVPALDKALEGWETRVTDRRAQRVPRPAGRRAPAPGARRQAAQDPVRHPGRRPRRRRSCCSPAASSRRRYERYVERRLREEFGFVGTPIILQQRPRRSASAEQTVKS